MEILKANLELSENLYKIYKDKIFIKDCYGNIGRICVDSTFPFHVINLEKLLHEVKVCFGAWRVTDTNLYAKHCFFKMGDDIVDPTICVKSSFKDDTQYLIAVEYNVGDYLDMVLANDCRPSLEMDTRPHYYKLMIECEKEDIRIIG